MEALEAIGKRRSVRSYSSKLVPKEIIEQIVDAGRRAPSGNNVQPWEFIVLTDRAIRKRIADITDWGKFIAQAAVCIAVYARDTKYYLEDGSAATENMLIAAAALGVGTCWVAGDKKRYCGEISQILKVPPSYKLVSLISLGYPAYDEPPKAKRPLEEVIHWEGF